MNWGDVVKSTQSGPAKYKYGVDIEKIERFVWREGNSVINGKSWKVFECDNIVGASSGVETKFMRVEMSANTIHGHPILYSEYKKLLGL